MWTVIQLALIGTFLQLHELCQGAKTDGGHGGARDLSHGCAYFFHPKVECLGPNQVHYHFSSGAIGDKLYGSLASAAIPADKVSKSCGTMSTWSTNSSDVPGGSTRTFFHEVTVPAAESGITATVGGWRREDGSLWVLCYAFLQEDAPHACWCREAE